MDDLRQLIGKNLTELRKRKGLTQLKLAEMFNYTDRAVSKWESGESLPQIDKVMEICELFKITADELLNEKIISTTSFTNFVNSFPSEYRGAANGAGNNNTTFENYLNKKIQSIKNNNSNYDIK